MFEAPRLMLVTAHPDDETLGFGGVLARYASEGVEICLVTATRGERGRYFGHAADSREHPGRVALAAMRERELRAAASTLGIRHVSLLRCADGDLDGANDVVSRLAWRIRLARPQVVMTFAPDGAYGHPDHIAVSQLTTAAIVAAADPNYGADRLRKLGPAHAVSKLFYLAWNE